MEQTPVSPSIEALPGAAGGTIVSEQIVAKPLPNKLYKQGRWALIAGIGIFLLNLFALPALSFLGRNQVLGAVYVFISVLSMLCWPLIIVGIVLMVVGHNDQKVAVSTVPVVRKSYRPSVIGLIIGVVIFLAPVVFVWFTCLSAGNPGGCGDFILLFGPVELVGMVFSLAGFVGVVTTMAHNRHVEPTAGN